MKRDMDLVRAIIFACEDVPPDQPIPSENLVDGFTDEVVAYHVHLMGQAGLLDVIDSRRVTDTIPQGMALSVTWAGHDFADSARDPAIWKKSKSALQNVGGAGFDIILATVKEYAKQALRDHGIFLP